MVEKIGTWPKEKPVRKTITHRGKTYKAYGYCQTEKQAIDLAKKLEEPRLINIDTAKMKADVGERTAVITKEITKYDYTVWVSADKIVKR
jgi:hypothetical protein